MDKEIAIAFLKANQPLPNDENLTEELISKYDEVRRFFIENPDDAVIPLFLNSFGSIDGFGVYQLVEDVFYKCDAKEVINNLKKSMTAANDSIRYWATQISASFPDEDLIDVLSLVINDENSAIRMNAIISLDMISSDMSLRIIRNRLSVETDNEIKNFIKEILMRR